MVGKQWNNGSTLQVSFLGGTEMQRALVERVAGQWTEEANLRLEFIESPNGDIRVAFEQGLRSWSYTGTDCLEVPPQAPTMNLAVLEPGVILHQFGRALGLDAEHRVPAGGIQWNEPAVIRDLAGPPNYWDEETVRAHFLRKFSVNQVRSREVDLESVMLLPVPKEWTLDGFEVRANQWLSAGDKAFVKSAEMYPPQADPERP